MSKLKSLANIGVLTLVVAVAMVGLAKITNNNKFFIITGLYIASMLSWKLSKLGLDAIGLSPSKVVAGLKLALPISLVIFVGGFVIFLVNPNTFADQRYNQDLTALILSILVVIPLSTVIIEELIFRGLLLALILRIYSKRIAMVLSAILFGLWHVLSAYFINISGVGLPFEIPKLLIILGVVIATSLAGWLLAWLRFKSDSLVTPMLVHWTINSIAVIMAYLAWARL